MTLTLGVWLLVVTTSGALAVFNPEIERILERHLYESSTGERSIGAGQAVESVREAFPGWTVGTVVDLTGSDNWSVELSRTVEGEEVFQTVYVDGGTGAVAGVHGEGDGSLMHKIGEFHAALSVAGLGEASEITIPLVDWNLATTILGGAGLALLAMVLTGLVLWWPGIRRFFARGFGMRLRRSPQRRNYDIHKVVGVVCLPVLAMWAFTGVNFEFYDETKRVWYAVLPGGDPPEPAEVTSAPGRPLGPDRAMELASQAVGGGRTTSVLVPPDETGAYELWVQEGFDPYRHYDWAGNVLLYLDQSSGEVLFDSRERYAQSPTSYAYENWTYPVHTGAFMSWGPRILWFLLGLAPLALGVTGLRMWWLKRSGRRAMRRYGGEAIERPPAAGAAEQPAGSLVLRSERLRGGS